MDGRRISWMSTTSSFSDRYFLWWLLWAVERSTSGFIHSRSCSIQIADCRAQHENHSSSSFHYTTAGYFSHSNERFVEIAIQITNSHLHAPFCFTGIQPPEQFHASAGPKVDNAYVVLAATVVCVGVRNASNGHLINLRTFLLFLPINNEYVSRLFRETIALIPLARFCQFDQVQTEEAGHDESFHYGHNDLSAPSFSCNSPSSHSCSYSKYVRWFDFTSTATSSADPLPHRRWSRCSHTLLRRSWSDNYGGITDSDSLWHIYCAYCRDDTINSIWTKDHYDTNGLIHRINSDNRDSNLITTLQSPPITSIWRFTIKYHRRSHSLSPPGSETPGWLRHNLFHWNAFRSLWEKLFLDAESMLLIHVHPPHYHCRTDPRCSVRLMGGSLTWDHPCYPYFPHQHGVPLRHTRDRCTNTRCNRAFVSSIMITKSEYSFWRTINSLKAISDKSWMRLEAFSRTLEQMGMSAVGMRPGRSFFSLPVSVIFLHSSFNRVRHMVG